MSKKIVYRGTLSVGTEERIKLSTLNGKTGYKITKFQIISTAPGTVDQEIVCKVMDKKDSNIGAVVEFTNSNLLAVSYISEGASVAYPLDSTIIIDNKKFNQDIFVSVSSANSSTQPVNYYIELESMSLSDLEASYLTLQNIRQITSR